MKVLHVCEYVKGGIATYLKEVIRFQKHDARISEVSIALSRYNSDDIGLEFSDLNVYYYNYKRKSRYFLKAILQIKNIINEIEPDVIHIHSTFAGVFVRTIYFFKRKRPKIVYCSHGWSFLMETNILKRFFYGMIERLLTYKTDLIINISKYELLGSLKYRIPQNKSVVIYNGLTSKTKKKENIDIKLDEDSINLCFVSI
ncbi:glycosyltransferase [Terrilactibacillus sp. S3-3]|nr:glycosyltransferase [Terrilactibacillus sp. S3-3]